MSDDDKRRVGVEAAKYVSDGMLLGLGTGSTVRYFAEAVGARIRDEGLRLACIPTSAQSRALAGANGLAVVDWDAVPAEGLDLCVDGADEIAPDFAMIKGGGGALLWEKIVAAAARRRIYIADGSKLVERLGVFPLPVEVVPFGHGRTGARLAEICGAATLRQRDGVPVTTDSGNLIYDCACGAIAAPAARHAELSTLPGVVETGLFIGLTDRVIAIRDGAIAETTPDHGAWWG